MQCIIKKTLSADPNENKNDPKHILGYALYINVFKLLPKKINGVRLSEKFINQFQNKRDKIFGQILCQL